MKSICSRFMLPYLYWAGIAVGIISCGGDNNNTSSLSTNSISVTVAAGPGGLVPNMAFVSVTVCEPGTYTCKTIDNIQLDTGSSGLRIFASTVKSLNLGFHSPTIYTCATFGTGDTWGTVQLGDIRMAGELASSMAIQVIDDSNNTAIPSGCSTGPSTPAALGANGIMGVSTNLYDQTPYYSSCNPTVAGYCQLSPPLNYQIQNPITTFAVNNNGLLIRLPQISAMGATSVTGNVIFGIDTQANNSSNGANFIPANSNGNFTTIFNGLTYPQSFIDSGSNMLAFNSNELPICDGGGYYCPTSTKTYTATMALKNNATSIVNFSVANANNLGSTYYAFNNLAGTLPATLGTQSFDWGLPFFFGRTVYVGISGKTSNAGTGPYYAYTDN